MPNTDVSASIPEKKAQEAEEGEVTEFEGQEPEPYEGIADAAQFEADMVKLAAANPPAKKKRKQDKRVRDPRDPSFFEIRFAALQMFNTFEEANTKHNLTAVRRYLFENDNERHNISRQAMRCRKSMRQKLKHHRWVELPCITSVCRTKNTM